MKKEKEYIVDIITGEVIWVSYSTKNILLAYNYLGFDTKRKIYFFNTKNREKIMNVIRYEDTMVS